jgi:hypothetical protein
VGHLLYRLMDRRESRTAVSRPLDVVIADDGDLLGNVDAIDTLRLFAPARITGDPYGKVKSQFVVLRYDR